MDIAEVTRRDPGIEDIKEKISNFSRHGWLHMYQMANFGRTFIPPVFVRGEGVFLYDQSGARYLDALSGAYCVNIGYGRLSVLEAARDAAQAIHYVSPFSAGNLWSMALCEKLAALAEPVVGPDARVFFVNSGAEGVETACKIARAVGRRTGRNLDGTIVSREGSFHGSTFGALTFGGLPEMSAEYGPLLGGVRRMPSIADDPASSVRVADLLEETRAAILAGPDGTGTPAAVLLEVMDTHSVTPSPDGYLQGVRRACDETGALLIVDECVTGFGRLGCWFGSERHGLRADMIVAAKGLTSGYEALGAVIVSKAVADVFLGPDELMFVHGSTFGGRPAACAAALEVIRIGEAEELNDNARRASAWLTDMLHEKVLPLPGVSRIRGEGLLLAIDICGRDGRPLDFVRTNKLKKLLITRGVITDLYAQRLSPVIELAPPLNVTQQECEFIVQTIVDALTAL